MFVILLHPRLTGRISGPDHHAATVPKIRRILNEVAPRFPRCETEPEAVNRSWTTTRLNVFPTRCQEVVGPDPDPDLGVIVLGSGTGCGCCCRSAVSSWSLP